VKNSAEHQALTSAAESRI